MRPGIAFSEAEEAKAFLARHAPRVDARLETLLPPIEASPPELHRAMRHAALGPGKRLRPALVLAAAGCESPAALDAGCAIELIHAFSLVHDDLPALDDDALRRGRPTCHVLFGEAVAILAGDALFALAFDVIARLACPPETTVAILRELTEATGSRGLVGGETADVLHDGRAMDAATLRDVHARKTGALLAACGAIGALAGGRGVEDVERLRSYGAALGLAFQIADDVLDATATVAEAGKTTGADGRRGKTTYATLYGVEAARTLGSDAVADALGCLRPEEAELAALARFALARRA